MEQITMENHQFKKVGQRNTETMVIQSNPKAKDKMGVVSPYIPIIILNVNGFNS